jgi:hypothetical protein
VIRLVRDCTPVVDWEETGTCVGCGHLVCHPISDWWTPKVDTCPAGDWFGRTLEIQTIPIAVWNETSIIIEKKNEFFFKFCEWIFLLLKWVDGSRNAWETAGPDKSIPADRERLDIWTSVAGCEHDAHPKSIQVSLEKRIDYVTKYLKKWNKIQMRIWSKIGDYL